MAGVVSKLSTEQAHSRQCLSGKPTVICLTNDTSVKIYTWTYIFQTFSAYGRTVFKESQVVSLRKWPNFGRIG